MRRKILLILSPLLILTIIFLALVYFISNTSGIGALQVTSLPSSSVYVDGKFLGKTPLCLCESSQMLKTGEYTIRLDSKKEGLDAFEQKIEISQGVLTAVDRTFDEQGGSQGSVISLHALSDKKNLELLVISFPNKAQVFVDDNPVGTTPVSLTNLTASDHDLKLTKEGYKDKIVKLKTIAGYRLETVVYMGIDTSSLQLTPVASSSSKIKILTTPTGFLRVRESNSLSSSEVGQVNPGEEFDLLDETDGWYKIRLSDGKEGWVSSDYAQKE